MIIVALLALLLISVLISLVKAHEATKAMMEAERHLIWSQQQEQEAQKQSELAVQAAAHARQIQAEMEEMRVQLQECQDR